jgi:sterol 3beta-glucosyltransferase
LHTFRTGRTFLYGYSGHVVPRPPDWTPANRVNGYWFLERPAPALLDFLAAGPAPVYVGFGSMNERNATDMTTMVLEALQRSRQRGVLLTGWGGLGAVDRAADVFVAEAIPHDWLFPLMAAVVHHGGAGTTAEGLRAGVPSVIIPYMGDQPFWGRRVQELRVGPKPLPRKRLTAERLAVAISEAVSNREMRQRAEALGESIRREDGVADAVGTIELELQRRPPPGS